MSREQGTFQHHEARRHTARSIDVELAIYIMLLSWGYLFGHLETNAGFRPSQAVMPLATHFFVTGIPWIMSPTPFGLRSPPFPPPRISCPLPMHRYCRNAERLIVTCCQFSQVTVTNGIICMGPRTRREPCGARSVDGDCVRVVCIVQDAVLDATAD